MSKRSSGGQGGIGGHPYPHQTQTRTNEFPFSRDLSVTPTTGGYSDPGPGSHMGAPRQRGGGATHHYANTSNNPIPLIERQPSAHTLAFGADSTSGFNPPGLNNGGGSILQTYTPPLPPRRIPHSPPRDDDANKQGYDYEFVPKPDNKYECPVCLLVLRNPHQTMCGHRFCKNCIHRWLRSPSPVHCPVCNDVITSSTSSLFPDMFANREIRGFNIRCIHYSEGCLVILALKDLQEHLETACGYEMVECPNRCPKALLRKDVEAHVQDECQYRMVTCEHCRQLVPNNEESNHIKECPDVHTICEFCNQSFLRKHIDTHKLEECEEIKMRCKFYNVGCNTQLTRKTLEKHNTSQMQVHMDMLVHAFNELRDQLHESNSSPPRRPPPSSQQYHPQAGESSYSYKSQRSGKYSHQDSRSKTPTPNTGSWEELSANYARTQYTHDTSLGLGLTACAEAVGDIDASMKPSFLDLDEKRRMQDGQLVKHEQQLLALSAKVETLDAKVREQAKDIQDRNELVLNLEARLSNGVFHWRIKEFSRQRQIAKTGSVTVLHSPGFYTSSYGFKLCIRANLNGVDGGNGSHISLFIHFMRGEFDDVLDWPFKGKITLSILDQGEPKQHIVEVLESKPTLAAFQRPHSNRNHKGFGYIEFAPIGLIENSSYVKHDTLIIKAEVREFDT